MKKIAVINDLSGFGKCSLSVAIPIISAMGIQCCPLTTGVFSNQTGYDSYKSVDFTKYMRSFIDEWKKLGVHFDSIVSGFISNSEQGKIIADFIDEFRDENTLVLVDPVMADDGEIYSFYDEKSVEAITHLASKADVITPNLTELCVLCKVRYNEIASLPYNEMLEKIANICKQLNKTVITTGIHINDTQIANTIYKDGQFEVVTTEKIGGSFSGTGDIFASILSAKLVNSSDIKSAVETACDFITKSIKETISDTNGNFNTADGIHFEKYLCTLGEQK